MCEEGAWPDPYMLIAGTGLTQDFPSPCCKIPSPIGGWSPFLRSERVSQRQSCSETLLDFRSAEYRFRMIPPPKFPGC